MTSEPPREGIDLHDPARLDVLRPQKTNGFHSLDPLLSTS